MFVPAPECWPALPVPERSERFLSRELNPKKFVISALLWGRPLFLYENLYRSVFLPSWWIVRPIGIGIRRYWLWFTIAIGFLNRGPRVRVLPGAPGNPFTIKGFSLHLFRSLSWFSHLWPICDHRSYCHCEGQSPEAISLSLPWRIISSSWPKLSHVLT